MAITWSRLHERLGIEAEALTYALVARAVREQLREDEQLEWKQSRANNDHGRAELGKDIAAMANSGGGLIVFGVGEKTSEDGAKVLDLFDVALVEQSEQQIRSVAAERVRPLVGGIVVELLENPASPGYGAVAVLVPASEDAPHFYDKAGTPPQAPWRNGPHVESMREQAIERAYRDRFRRRQDEAVRLEHLVASAASNLAYDWSRGTARWCVVALAPHASVPLGVGAPDRSTAERAADTSRGVASNLLRPDKGRPELRDELGSNARVGLRRWVFWGAGSRSGGDDDERSHWAYAELRHDGSVVLALPAAHPHGPQEGRSVLVASAVELTVAYAIGLARFWTSELRITGAIAARIAVVSDRPLGGRSWLFTADVSQARPGVAASTHGVDVVEPADTTLEYLPGTDADRAAANELARGVLNQFGSDALNLLRPPP